MLQIVKNSIDFLTTPTISFTLLSIFTLILFPPTDWLDKISRKLKVHKLWTNKGGILGLTLITIFMVMGYTDPNFSKILMKPDNFPIVLLIYSMFFYIWWGMKQAYENDIRIEEGIINIENLRN